MIHDRSLTRRGPRMDRIVKEPIDMLPRVIAGAAGIYAIQEVSKDFPTTAILLMGYEFENAGLIGYADEVHHELTETDISTWYLRAIMPRMRKLYTVKALAGHFTT